MFVTEIERIYPCIICPKAYPTKQGLRAHMKKHKNDFVRTTIYARRDLWARFDEAAKRHKTTTCALLDVLIKATLEGSEKGVIDVSRIGSPNPVIIQVNEVFLGQPRSGWKTQIPGGAMLGRLEDPAGKLWPPSCHQADVFWKDRDPRKSEVGCLKVKAPVHLRDCWLCFQAGLEPAPVKIC